MALKRQPAELARVLEWLRRDGDLSSTAEEAFDHILRVVEHVAGHEELVRAPERELEPDALARRFVADAETLAFRSVNALLADFSAADLERIERTLLSLQKRHGAILSNPPSHRVLLDAAVLGSVGYVYSRKYREVLTSHLLTKGDREPAVFPTLAAGVDELFQGSRPPYLWRLGPEFGTDRNITALLERGDQFIVRGLYPTRARRFATDVAYWAQVGDYLVGEYCVEQRYAHPLRTLVLRPIDRRGDEALLLTTLFNTPWERILQLHHNRAGKHSHRVEVEKIGGWTGRQRIAASLLILALFTFRNVRTWAVPLAQAGASVSGAGSPASSGGTAGPAGATQQAGAGAQEAAEHRAVRLNTERRSEVLDHMGVVVSHLVRLTRSDDVAGVSERFEPGRYGYDVVLDQSTTVPNPTAGTVMFVDRVGEGVAGKTVVVYHGRGFSTVHSGFANIAGPVVVGAELGEGTPLGDAAGLLHFEAHVHHRYIHGGAEPSVAEVLMAEASVLLDPLALLAEARTRRDERMRAELLDHSVSHPSDHIDAAEDHNHGSLSSRGLRNILWTHAGDRGLDNLPLGDVEILILEGGTLDTPIAFLVNTDVESPWELDYGLLDFLDLQEDLEEFVGEIS